MVKYISLRFESNVLWILAFMSLFLFRCTTPQSLDMNKTDQPLTHDVIQFGKTSDGEAQLYRFKNANGMEVRITNYGGIITHLFTPDKSGNLNDITLGFDSLEQYLAQPPYFGALIGRYGNRIAKGKFSIGEEEYILAVNNGQNHLHGGIKGFDKVLWNAKVVEKENAIGLLLTYLSPDGEEGYPGNLSIQVHYWINNENELTITYEATTDKTTPVNLTNHAYFNLAGVGNGDILNHELKIVADAFLPVDATLIPTGILRATKGTPFDFLSPTPIGASISDTYEQIQLGGGYDHNFVLNKTGKELTLAATAYEPTTGRLMEVFTEEPGIQFYSGNFLNGTLQGKGTTYTKRTGFCLETQHFPNSPNQSDFPSTLLQPGETYRTSTVYKFSVRR